MNRDDDEHREKSEMPLGGVRKLSVSTWAVRCSRKGVYERCGALSSRGSCIDYKKPRVVVLVNIRSTQVQALKGPVTGGNNLRMRGTPANCIIWQCDNVWHLEVVGSNPVAPTRHQRSTSLSTT